MIGQEVLGLEGALAARQFSLLATSKPNAEGGAAPPSDESRTEVDRVEKPALGRLHSSDVGADRTVSLVVEEPRRAEAKSTAIETRSVPVRGGRHPGPESYPFGSLEPLSVNSNGQRIGPCFFIPDEDDPRRLLTAARKRHRPKVFITRTDVQKGGRWVWRLK